MALRLHDKVAIITGASSGIGAGTAVYFAKLGAKLNLIGRNEENLQKILNEIKTLNPNCTAIITSADVSQESDVERIIQTTVDKFNQIDILINNAGILGTGSIEQTSLQQYDTIMNTNVRSIYHLTMLAVPYLIKTRGSIVNVSSVNGIRSFPGVLAYCVSKAAVDQFTQCVALDIAAKGVRVNSVNPGVIVTDVHKRAGMNDEKYKEFLEHSCSTHALGRPGHVQEVAHTIAFLASNESSFITGASLPVDGGRHAMVNINKF